MKSDVIRVAAARTTKPIKHRRILMGQYLGVAGALVAALTVLFTAIAFLGAVATRDKAKGVGLALLVWFYFALLHNGIMLLVMLFFEEYPLEKPTMAMIALNPIDLGRIIVLLHMDVSAMMGYTGALMKDMLGTATGISAAGGILALWAVLPVLLSLRIFRKKDL